MTIVRKHVKLWVKDWIEVGKIQCVLNWTKLMNNLHADRGGLISIVIGYSFDVIKSLQIPHTHYFLFLIFWKSILFDLLEVDTYDSYLSPVFFSFPIEQLIDLLQNVKYIVLKFWNFALHLSGACFLFKEGFWKKQSCLYISKNHFHWHLFFITFNS